MRHLHPAVLWIVGVGLVVAALLPAVRVGQERGWLAGVAAFPLLCLAVLAAVLACLFLLFGLAHVAEFVRRGGPLYPPCHNGTCKGRRWPSLHQKDRGDYKRVWVDDDSVLRCKCGRDYVTQDAERRFMERLPNGSLTPYMVHRPFRGWFPDTGTEY